MQATSTAGGHDYITPEGFDLYELEKRGYGMEIKVTYDVYYKKDWGIGLGYAGSPKYEVSVFDSDGMGVMDKDMTTKTSKTTRTITLTSGIVDLKNTKLFLKFSTDNVQNIIHFENIRVDYRCFKR